MPQSFWFRAACSVGVLAVLLARLDLGEAGRALAAVELRAWLAALAVDAAARAVMIARWTVLLRAAGSSVPASLAARIFFVTSFVGIVLPTGGADVARAVAVSRHTDRQGLGAASVVVDRLLGVAALLTLAAASAALGLAAGAPPLAGVLAWASLAGAVLMLAAFGADRLAGWLAPPAPRRGAIGGWLVRAAEEVARYRRRPRVLAVVFGLSLAVQWLRVASWYLVGAGLGVSAAFGHFLIFLPVVFLAFMLPISIAGVGLPQGVMMWVLRPLGVPDAQGFVFSTLVVILGLLGALPGLVLYLRARRAPS